MDLLRRCSNVLWLWCAVWTLAEGSVGNLTIGGMARGSLDREGSRVYTLTVDEDYGEPHPVSSGAACRARTPEQGAFYFIEILVCVLHPPLFRGSLKDFPLHHIVCLVQFCGLSFIAHIFVCVCVCAHT